MLLSIVFALMGVIATFYVAHLQKQRGRVQIVVSIEKESHYPSHNQDHFYLSKNSNLTIDLTVAAKSQHNFPLEIGGYVIGVPKIQWLEKPKWLIKNRFIIRNISLPSRKHKMAEKLLPREKASGVHISGLEVADALAEHGYNGTITVMIGVFDENKNAYYSQPFQLSIEEWKNDRGTPRISWL